MGNQNHPPGKPDDQRFVQQIPDQIVNAIAELEDRKAKIKELEEKLKERIGQCHTLQEQMSNLNNQLAHLQYQNQSMQEKLAQSVRERGQDQQEVRRLNDALKRAQDELQTQKALYATKERETERLREQLARRSNGNMGANTGEVPAVAPIRVSEVEPEPINNPPGFEKNAEEQREHPHEKAWPVDGRWLNLMNGTWRIIGASQRGRGHQNGLYRDDDFDIRNFDNGRAAFIAIADGVGSRPFARYGARAAVLGATQSVAPKKMQELIDEIQRKNTDELRRDAVAQSIIHDALVAAQKHVNVRAAEKQHPPDDLHSTLLTFLVVPHSNADGDQLLYVASAQVGDGVLEYRQEYMQAEPTWDFIEAAQASGINNQVQPLLRTTENDWHYHFKDLEPGAFLMGMTDGIADDLELVPDPDNGYFKGREHFYQLIRDQALNTAAPAQNLSKFLTYRKRQSFDDRTLVCVYRSTEGK